jgi:hypothetical protein
MIVDMRTRMTIKIPAAMLLGMFVLCSTSFGQKAVKRPSRATPPTFKSDEFSGVFFPDAVAQLQGDFPGNSSMMAGESNDNASKNGAVATGDSDSGASNAEGASEGNAIWKTLIADSTIEDLVKESKTRLDAVITTPAGFAGSAPIARREFTLLATIMAVVAQYPEEIRWQASAEYGRRIFANMADNCKVGTQVVFNQAKLRHQDLQTMLKGTKISGNAEEVSWDRTADRGPTMQIMEWALRENLTPITNSDTKFRSSQDEVIKYAELLAVLGQVVRQPGMTDADDPQYAQLAAAMSIASQEVTKAVRTNDSELARTAVSRIDQSCNKCHESYR